ncbi:hypothetical protein S40285_08492 [Stachybotrys chlorohalonatus IBT 40285]|uniref:DASH complex subunit DUO1 n=1 Tax=Stachybotrys chlorohalonatus (strain IBT 40285) TaxID=1283841 RepID=A0A084QIB3_STAC4|nr:hypothetical protein S40285_08492 [Stachybotrys chlorohalonata IBT 40285]
MADTDEHDESSLWESSTEQDPVKSRPKTPRTPKTPKTPSASDPVAEPGDHEAALRKELEGVRSINQSIEGVIASLERAGGNMNTVCQTVSNASTLLNTWTRILSQTEHNQRLILDPSWKGATEDQAEQAAEAVQRQLAAQRKAAEEERRREEIRRRRDEEEERRKAAPTVPSRGSRGSVGTRGTRARGRGTARGGSSTDQTGDRSASNAAGGRGSTFLTRGAGTSRYRSRGVR